MLDLDKEALTIFPTLDLGPDCEGSNLVGRVRCVEDDGRAFSTLILSSEVGAAEKNDMVRPYAVSKRIGPRTIEGGASSNLRLPRARREPSRSAVEFGDQPAARARSPRLSYRPRGPSHSAGPPESSCSNRE